MLADPRQDALSSRQVAERISRLALGVCENELRAAGPRHDPVGARRPAALRAARRPRGCADAIEPLCREKSLTLRTDLPDEAQVDGDGTLVNRIVHNLLTNAVRYTESGEISLSARLEARGLRIEVADTGIGIADSDRERIFEEFCRLDHGRRMAPLGTGLGLATVRRLCEQLRGSIEIESRSASAAPSASACRAGDGANDRPPLSRPPCSHRRERVNNAGRAVPGPPSSKVRNLRQQHCAQAIDGRRFDTDVARVPLHRSIGLADLLEETFHRLRQGVHALGRQLGEHRTVALARHQPGDDRVDVLLLAA